MVCIGSLPGETFSPFGTVDNLYNNQILFLFAFWGKFMSLYYFQNIVINKCLIYYSSHLRDLLYQCFFFYTCWYPNHYLKTMQWKVAVLWTHRLNNEDFLNPSSFFLMKQQNTSWSLLSSFSSPLLETGFNKDTTYQCRCGGLWNKVKRWRYADVSKNYKTENIE